ncbi:MAG TPA: DUF2796 domain-containing protein [Polyangiales bacterium]|nr:DUF2796 domain-containing protein [Polyangiales bacterium]
MAANLRRALCIALLCATTCAAADDDLFEEHHAHEHGTATLDVALDGTRLQLHFRTPAINLLGFEHAPRSPKEQDTAARSTRLLRDGAAQFQPSAAARCQIVTTRVTEPDWSASEEHADFEAEYEFRCERPAALKQLEVRLLSQLDEHLKVRAQVASGSGQHGAELTHANPTLPLQVQR